MNRGLFYEHFHVVTFHWWTIFSILAILHSLSPLSEVSVVGPIYNLFIAFLYASRRVVS